MVKLIFKTFDLVVVIYRARIFCPPQLFTAMAICPLELVKIRMQAGRDVSDPGKPKPGRPSAGQVMRSIWRTAGFAGFYRGLGATVVRECGGGAVFFGAYELARERLKPAGGRKEDCDVAATVAAGAVAGATMWLTAYPADAIKSRAQMSDGPSGGLRLVRDEARTAGLRAVLYGGLWPTLLKAVPVAGALLCAVEFSKPYYRDLMARMRLNDRLPWLDAVLGPLKSIEFCDFTSGWAAGPYDFCILDPAWWCTDAYAGFHYDVNYFFVFSNIIYIFLRCGALKWW